MILRLSGFIKSLRRKMAERKEWRQSMHQERTASELEILRVQRRTNPFTESIAGRQGAEPHRKSVT